MKVKNGYQSAHFEENCWSYKSTCKSEPSVSSVCAMRLIMNHGSILTRNSARTKIRFICNFTKIFDSLTCFSKATYGASFGNIIFQNYYFLYQWFSLSSRFDKISHQEKNHFFFKLSWFVFSSVPTDPVAGNSNFVLMFGNFKIILRVVGHNWK